MTKQRITLAPKSEERKREAQLRVARALNELFRNPETPTQLYEAIDEFICEALNQTKFQSQYRESFLLDLVKTVDDPMWQRLKQLEEAGDRD